MRTHRDVAISDALAFNKSYPVGTRVRYWEWDKHGDGIVSTTRTEATVIGDHTAAVWVDGCASFISLLHIEPIVEVSDEK